MQPNAQKKNPAGGPGFSRTQTLGSGLRHDSSATPIDTLLARLEGVQRSGKGYRAQCPACGGTSRKLSLCEGDNGAVVMTCFSCHDTPAVMDALGLCLADLFPRRITHATTPQERRELRQRAKESQWGAALDVLAREADIVLAAARMTQPSVPLAADDDARLCLAVDRIASAKEVLRG